MPHTPELLDEFTDQNGVSLLALSRRQPVLVVFLRHSGCTFCRQALADLRRERQQIVRQGTEIALVFMESLERAGRFAAEYGLGDVPRISDPQQRLYAAFELSRGAVGRVAGPRVWWRGLWAVLAGHFPGVPHGDVTQMPGAFLVHQGQIVKSYRHATSADRPDYCELALPVHT
ncbi:MAG: AhpC/TSA family protein [Planctomycetaceae bacterium]|nr:MAG: AhpC/TSA family protein [Planctomycetaceae bacterium]